MLNIPKDFRDFIKLLNLNNARYLIVGGYAVAYHGYPKATGDIDFFLDRSQENAAAVKRCLVDFGFDSLDITVEDQNTYFISKDDLTKNKQSTGRLKDQADLEGLV